MSRHILAVALLLGGTCLAVAGEGRRDDPAPATSPGGNAVTDLLGARTDPLGAPGPVGSGPGDVAPPTPSPSTGFRDGPRITGAEPTMEPSIVAAGPRRGTMSCGGHCPGQAEAGVGGPLGDLALMRRIIQGGNEEGGPGPVGNPMAAGGVAPGAPPSGYRDLVGRWSRDAARHLGAASLPPGARRDVPPEGYDATIAKLPPGPATPPLAPSELATAPMPGDPCRLARGGTVEVVGQDRDLGTLVRYADPVPRVPGECAPGTLAFVPDRVVSGWPAGGDVLARARAYGATASAAADRILAGTPPAP